MTRTIPPARNVPAALLRIGGILAAVAWEVIDMAIIAAGALLLGLLLVIVAGPVVVSYGSDLAEVLKARNADGLAILNIEEGDR